jgi:hypothetical protein
MGCGLAFVCRALPQSLDSLRAATSLKAPLSAEQVAQKLQARDQQRVAALAQIKDTRIYRLKYYGVWGNRDAELVAKVTYRAPDFKQFTVVSQSGSRFIIDHVLKNLMQSEQQYLDDNHDGRSSALSTENYNFTLAGYETAPEGAQYVLKVTPKSANKFLYRGKIWVDAKDFAVVRIEAEPAHNPSIWIRKTEIDHRYAKVDGFWVPAEDHTESFLRLGGRAVLSIEYKDYKITKAAPIAGIEILPSGAK